MSAPKAALPYVRFDSSLLLAMDGMKQLTLPPSSAEKKPWIFELRTLPEPHRRQGKQQGGNVQRGRNPDHERRWIESGVFRTDGFGRANAQSDLHGFGRKPGGA